jgi:hypothetical protein|tara:strand:- start:2190 stop:2657 length:468 start_codon:yes stop_codon:yes gene_type:complete
VFRILLSLLLLTALAEAQDPNPDENLRAPGQRTVSMQDSVTVAVAGIDTSLGVWIGGADKIRYYVEYESRNDSINVDIFLDIAPINKKKFYTVWGKIDSMVVSGTADTTHYRSLTDPPFDAFYGRLRAVGAMPSGDTVDVTTKLTLARFPGARYH